MYNSRKMARMGGEARKKTATSAGVKKTPSTCYQSCIQSSLPPHSPLISFWKNPHIQIPHYCRITLSCLLGLPTFTLLSPPIPFMTHAQNVLWAPPTPSELSGKTGWHHHRYLSRMEHNIPHKNTACKHISQ